MKLKEPHIIYKNTYLEMIEEWISSGEEFVPFTLEFDTSDFEKFIRYTNSFKTVKPEGFVHHSTFWLITENEEIAGVSNLRHYLNEKLLTEGGHIGFGIRPSFRRKGYASKLLELTLIEAKKLDITKALLTCDKSNTGSSRTIQKNNGILWKEQSLEGIIKQYFWIDIR